MNSVIEITPLPGSSVEGGRVLDKQSYRVVVSDGTRRVTIEARLSLSLLEILAEPEECVRKHFERTPLPGDGSVVDVA